MTFTLQTPQFCGAITSADMGAVKTTIAGSSHTVTIPNPSTYYFNNRRNNSSDLIKALATALTAADSETWSVTWDTPTQGYYELNRTGSPATLSFEWADAATTVDPQLFGFATATKTVTPAVKIASDYQAGRLWIPREPWSRWDRSKKTFGRRATRPFDERTISYRYSQKGALSRALVELELVPALFVFVDRSSRSDFRDALADCAADDPNVALEALLQETWDSDGPLRCWPDWTDLATYEDRELLDDEPLLELDGESADETNVSPQLYTVQLRLKSYVSAT